MRGGAGLSRGCERVRAAARASCASRRSSSVGSAVRCEHETLEASKHGERTHLHPRSKASLAVRTRAARHSKCLIVNAGTGDHEREADELQWMKSTAAGGEVDKPLRTATIARQAGRIGHGRHLQRVSAAHHNQGTQRVKNHAVRSR
jgi:hypothetical protein